MTDEQLRRTVEELFRLKYDALPMMKQRITQLEDQLYQAARGPEQMPEVRSV